MTSPGDSVAAPLPVTSGQVSIERGTTVSELLREAASDIVNATAVPTVVTYRAVPQPAGLGRSSSASGHSRGDHIAPSRSPTRVSGYVQTA